MVKVRIHAFFVTGVCIKHVMCATICMYIFSVSKLNIIPLPFVMALFDVGKLREMFCGAELRSKMLPSKLEVISFS